MAAAKTTKTPAKKKPTTKADRVDAGAPAVAKSKKPSALDAAAREPASFEQSPRVAVLDCHVEITAGNAHI